MNCKDVAPVDHVKFEMGKMPSGKALTITFLLLQLKNKAVSGRISRVKLAVSKTVNATVSLPVAPLTSVTVTEKLPEIVGDTEGVVAPVDHA